jgi:hypothetical protein
MPRRVRDVIDTILAQRDEVREPRAGVYAMNSQRPRQHRVWRPRMSADHEFNPFVRSTGSEASIDRGTLEEIEELKQESDAREDEPEPIKIRP